MESNNKEIILNLNEKLSLKKRLEKEKQEKEKYLSDLMKRNEELGKINKNYIEYHKFLHNELQEARGNIRVYCRIRPKLNKEKIEDNTPDNYIEFPNNNTVIINGPTVTYSFIYS
jgi:kinesin family protein C1